MNMRYTDILLKQKMKMKMNFMKVYKETWFNRTAVMPMKPTIQTHYAVVLEHSHSVRYVVFIFIVFYWICTFQT